MGLLSIIRKIKRKEKEMRILMVQGSGQLGEDDYRAQDQRGGHQRHQPHPRLQHQDHQVQQRLAGASLLVFANKQDIQGALKPAEIAKVLNLEVMDRSRHWKIVGCSAYTGEGLLDVFDWLAAQIYVLD